jgi:hypothetical protein
MQSLHKSLQVMFCPTSKVEVKDHFYPADNFSNDLFPFTKSYPPGSSVTFHITNRIYGFIPEAYLHDCAHSSTIKTMIILNSKLMQISWRLVEWELWG